MFRKLCFWRRGSRQARRPACLPGPIPPPTPLDSYRLEVLTRHYRIAVDFNEAIRRLLNKAPEQLGLLLGLNEPFTIRLEHSTWTNGLSKPPLHVATYYYPCYNPSQLRQAAAAQAGWRRAGPKWPAGTISYYVFAH
ncbi:hypothetical protein KTAU_27120 [Thermogemmatispora aurantia]|uniref:hypothetical protein n=1 Tax=Thermogemmatispora TaxID=768669 RepID=UPI000852B671|nr:MULTISPECIES: hypothetical protein [Thermogemmatispora]GER84075.1 hypothetical protein KTAU_27120 [Thermogemmatispora aurantia]